MSLFFLIQKEFIQIRRNSFLPKLIIMFPIVIMCVMPWVMNMEVKNISIDIVDNDHSTLSHNIVSSIAQSNYFILNGQAGTYQEALQDIEHSKADMTLVIPANFEKELMYALSNMTELPQVLIAANSVNGTKGAMGSAYLVQIISQFTNPQPSSISQKSPVSTLFLYNKNLSYKLFMIPALFAIIIMLMCGFLPALNIVGEKESGTIEQMNVTPVKKWEFILAKLIPYWLIALFVISVCLVLSWAIYGIVSKGQIGLIFLLAMLLALFFSSLGLLISNYSDTLQQAIFVMWFFVIIMMLLSGLFTPTRSMPQWSYLTTYINPMHYFIDAIRTVFVRGGSIANISHQILALFIIGSFMATLAVRSYKKNS